MTGMRKRCKKLLYNADEYLAALCAVSLVAVTLMGVFMRYVLSNPIKWTEEVSLGLFVWYIFLGASSAVKKNLNITIEFVVELFPKKVQDVIAIFSYLLTYAVMTVMVVIGIRFCIQTQLKITPVLRLPYTVIASALPVGFGLMMIHQTIQLVRGWHSKKSEEVER